MQNLLEIVNEPTVQLSILGVVVVTMGFLGAPLFLWTGVIAAGLFILEVPTNAWIAFGSVAFVFNVTPIRRFTVSNILMNVFIGLKLVPKISQTEKTALNAGAVWADAEFFSGRPDFKKLSQESYPDLTSEERAYLEGPINELCEMIDDWKISQNKEIPVEVWDFMRKIKIFGMIIPKEYGGLGFSALAHSEVIMKLSSRSIPVTITAMVPNSLGPAELLNHFGTQDQKNHYLPKLATGEYIPCFALTEQRAGSDAGALESNGELFEKNGELHIRLNWNKRWITLAAAANVLGLAFELRDPDKLLGDKYIIGITCALIPSETDGVVLGRRHDPLSIPFYNCPTQGENVEIPASFIIGGIENAGKGWSMLMDSLGAGRGISLPAQAVGGSKLVTRVVTSHSSIRRQFGISLSQLEGVEEPIGRIAGYTYMLEAMRKYTVGALDNGIKPSVITAIAKYQSTEIARKVINDGMDIMAGSGISRGPRNLISNIYTAMPIGITVEGANIPTRTLIVFGQGLMRAHPFAYKEVEAIESRNLAAFDKAFWGHVGHVVRTTFRSVLLSLTRGRLASTPNRGPTKRYYQKLAWTSATFALMADIAMGTLGGKLKVKEKLTGRYADILSWMYIGTAVLRRFEADGSKREDLPFVHFAMRHAFVQIQESFDGIFANLKVPGFSWVFSYVIRTWSRFNQMEWGFDDRVSQRAAKAALRPGEARDRLSQGIFYPTKSGEALNRLETAYAIVKKAEEVEQKIIRAIRRRKLPKKRIFKVIDEALELNVINEHEAALLHESASHRWEACKVDDFSEEEYHGVDGSDNKQFRKDYVGPGGAPEHYRYKKAA